MLWFAGKMGAVYGKTLIMAAMRGNIGLGILVTLWGLSGCVPLVITNPYPPREGEHKEEKHESKGEKHEVYGIPKGHLPPPGHCRIWYPNRPAGQQPPRSGAPSTCSRFP
jgi:hypothetical protein